MSVSSQEDLGETPKSRRRLLRNPIPDFFQQVEDSSNCKECPKKLKDKNPTTLQNHLKSFHKNSYKEFSEKIEDAKKERIKKI